MKTSFSSPSKRDASVLQLAQEHGIISLGITPQEMATRADFEEQAYGLVREPLSGRVLSGPKKTSTSKSLTKEKWDLRVFVLSNYTKGDPEKKLILTQFQRKYRQDWHNFAHLQLHKVGDTVLLYHQHPNKKKPRRLVVHMEQVYDVISKNHTHQGYQKTKNAVDEKYWNVTEGEVKLFHKLCPVCMTKNLPKKLGPGCVKPIKSFDWRDRFQVDLISYLTDPQPLWYWVEDSPTMRYLMVLKDHFTRLCYAAPISAKKPEFVACELRKIFQLIGYPLIFQTDNGQEFSDSVLEILGLTNPYMLTTRGRPRTPRDQGSVERLNRPLKQMIDSFVVEKKMKLSEWLKDSSALTPSQAEHCRHASWVTEYPDVVYTLNGSKSYGYGQVQPYTHVFGQDMRRPEYEVILESLPESQVANIKKPEDLCKLLPESYLQKMLYLSELDATGKQLPPNVDTMEEITTPNMKDITKSLPLKSPPNQMKPPPNQMKPRSIQFGEDSVEEAEKDDKKQATGIEDREVKTEFRTEGDADKITVKEALKRLSTDVVTVVHAQMWCRGCHNSFNGNFHRVPVFAGDDLEDLYSNTEWFSSQLCMGFMRLKYHEFHPESVLLLPPPNHTNELANIPKYHRIDIPTCITQIAFPMLSESHFALAILHLENKVVEVIDGLGKKLKNWQDNMMYALIVAQLIEAGSSARKTFKFHRRDSDVYNDHPAATWTVGKSSRFQVVQRDSTNCGPISCYSFWKLVDQKCPNIEDPRQMRSEILDEYKRLKHKFDGQMFVYKNIPEVFDAEADAWLDGAQARARIEEAHCLELSSEETETEDDAKPKATVQEQSEGDQSVSTPETTELNVLSSPSFDFLSSPACSFITRPKPRKASLKTQHPELFSDDESDVFLPHELTKTTKSNRKPPPESNKTPKPTGTPMSVDTHSSKSSLVSSILDADERSQRTRMMRDAMRVSSKNKRRKLQDHQAQQMKSRRIKSLPFLQKGSLVTLKPDSREQANLSTRGVMAVVLECSKARSIVAATEYGVIGNEGKRRWFPPEKYISHETSNRCFGPIAETRIKILANSYNEATEPMIGLPKVCTLLYGGKTGKRSCHCKPRRGCLGGCGCRSAGLPCNSSCKCNGNCSWTLESHH